jgi:hypothetical protein
LGGSKVINNFMGLLNDFIKNKQKTEDNRRKILDDISKKIMEMATANNLNVAELADLSRWLSDWSVKSFLETIKKLDKKD